MELENLKQHLLDESTLLYGILDAAIVPELPMRLFKERLPFHCLLAGDLESDLMHVAPYIVYLPEESDFTAWLLDEGFGDDWGIFVHSRQPLTKMRQHFRPLLNTYDEAGNTMTFRFYDPRVLRQFLPSCKPEELISFFGNVDTLFAESETGDSLLRFELRDEALTQTALN